jgi:hypothetical protein
MPDINEFEEYQLSEADIDKVLSHLRAKDPAATPEDAIAYLERYAKLIHDAGHVMSDDDLRKMYESFRDGEV